MSNNWCDAIRNLEQRIANLEVKQRQTQEQEQEQDQDVKSILRDIGNNTVTVDIDNDSIAVAILASLGYLTGAMDAQTLRTYVDKFAAKKS